MFNYKLTSYKLQFSQTLTFLTRPVILHILDTPDLLQYLQLMQVNRLEEMKKRLLLQTQLKKENQESYASPRLPEDPPPQTDSPAHIPSQPNKSKQAEEEQEQLESPDESNSAEKVVRNDDLIEQQHKQEGNVNQGQLKQMQQPINEEEGELKANAGGPIDEEKGENQKEQEERQVQNQQNLELGKDQNAFMSVDEQVRQVVSEKINEIQKEAAPEQSKAEKKVKKIVLKELLKVKECIKNLQSAVIGLQHIKERVKYYPSLKGRLEKYIKQLKQLNKE